MNFLSLRRHHGKFLSTLSSNLFLVPTLSFTRLFLLLSVCGTASIVPCVLRLLLFHLNGNLLIYAPMGVMSRISSTLLLTCIPCFHANIINKKQIINKNLECGTGTFKTPTTTLNCHQTSVYRNPNQLTAEERFQEHNLVILLASPLPLHH